MPLFFFDFHEDGALFSDEVGHQCRDLEQAECEAAKAAAEMTRDRMRSAEPREITINVLDQDRQKLLSVTVTMRVDRVATPRVGAKLAHLLSGGGA